MYQSSPLGFWIMIFLMMVPAVLVLCSRKTEGWTKVGAFFLCLFFSWPGYLIYCFSFNKVHKT